jgi:DNA repair exonuclease SbcCD nuclease subunit
LAHFSDTHLGYSAYEKLSPNGENQRSLDVVRSFVNVAKDIERWDPPLVVHSGDVGDRSRLDIRYLLLVQQWLARLATRRPNGSRRQVVVISGNHDQPRAHKEACFLELFGGIPGVHIVTNRYAQIDMSTVDDVDPTIADLVVHALPHDQLKSVDFDLVTPVAERTNVLVAHGVAGGSELYRRSLGREYPITTDVLSRDWDYVALGHWHKQGPVPLVATGAISGESEVGRVWYAGSPENMGFGDLTSDRSGRGYLRVEVGRGVLPEVERIDLPIRSMIRLPVIVADELTPEQIASSLVEQLNATQISGAVVSQIVTGTSREIWSLVDKGPAKAAAASALHYVMTPRFARNEDSQATEPESGAHLGDLGDVLAERAAEMLSADEREPALELARRLLGIELAGTAVSELASDGDTPIESEPGSDGGRSVEGGVPAVTEVGTVVESAAALALGEDEIAVDEDAVADDEILDADTSDEGAVELARVPDAITTEGAGQ